LDVWYIKGFDTILDCWQRLASKYPDWVLEIAGDGTEASVDFLKKAIIQRNLTDKVKLLGQIDNMQETLSTTSIFALPSRVEGFPMVLMEAMSQGCACVAYEVGGATYEMINNEEDGLIIPDADIDSFEKGLSRLIENAELREKLSKNALVSIQRFSPSSFMKSWEKLIEKVVNRG
jgi:glycosyltransferase involved in cell wall biosynthesis